MYNFDEQLQKGKKFEQHFFKHLERAGRKPVFNNPNGNNKAYDILANRRKYEVKADFYKNQRFPIELHHFNDRGHSWQGWLYTTESDYIAFYKHSFRLRFYLHTKTLFDFVAENFCQLKEGALTTNKGYQTWNKFLSYKQLKAANIVREYDRY